jgi:hypothetical protein
LQGERQAEADRVSIDGGDNWLADRPGRRADRGAAGGQIIIPAPFGG